MRYKGFFNKGEPHGKGMLWRYDKDGTQLAQYVGMFERGFLEGRAKVFMAQDDGRNIEKDYIFRENVVIHTIGDDAL